MKKRMISILLAAVLVVGMIPFSKVSAFAELLEVVPQSDTEV